MVNNSKRFKHYFSQRMSKLASLCTVSLLSLICTNHSFAQYDHFDQLPDLGSNAANFLSERDAEQLGAAFIRQSRYQSEYIYDPELVEYIQQLGNKLVASSDYPARQFHFYLIANNVINAFAVPGGHVAMHSAILAKSESESELASVIAHEISHISQRHIERKLEASRYDSFIALGALLAAAAAGGSDAAQAAFGVANATILDRQLSYSRGYEAEADSHGIRLLSKAGFDPQAMPVFFKRLLDNSRLNDIHAPEFLRSHPLTVSRITETAQRAGSYPSGDTADEERFRLMQAKAIALYSKSAIQARDSFKDKLNKGDNSLPTRFGYALALSQNTQYDEARSEINALLKDYPDNVSLRLIQADNELEAREIMLGLNLMADLYEQEVKQNNHAIDLYYANALVLTNQHDVAIPILRSAIANDREEPFYHTLLARAYGENNQPLLSLQSRGEYHYLRGNYEFAVRQFNRALKMVRTDYDKARIEARIVDCESQIESLKKLR